MSCPCGPHWVSVFLIEYLYITGPCTALLGYQFPRPRDPAMALCVGPDDRGRGLCFYMRTICLWSHGNGTKYPRNRNCYSCIDSDRYANSCSKGIDRTVLHRVRLSPTVSMVLGLRLEAGLLSSSGQTDRQRDRPSTIERQCPGQGIDRCLSRWTRVH